MATVGPHALTLINLEKFKIRDAELQKLRAECKEMVEHVTVQGIDDATHDRCEEQWRKITEMVVFPSWCTYEAILILILW
ncbi:MAG: hypothetical protein CL912_33275 [Deltaproteobacteria bacterium]|nr:hypothetical protein [Deltaproteobacteria bacterium]|tara:strand:+ start:633 stop:872 length:240 start_codon:yes stop_codon:yes gene_type:complete